MESGDDFVLKEHEIDLATSRVVGKWTFISKGKVTSNDMRLRMYSLHEMIAMFEHNGLEFVEAWGNTNKEQLSWDHQRMIVVAKKQNLNNFPISIRGPHEIGNQFHGVK